MKGKIKNFLENVLSQDMAQQARQVEVFTLLVFVVLLLTIAWLWQFKINISVPVEEGREIIARMNIFELLLLKK